LQDADLIIELPDDIQVLGEDNNTKLLKKSLGDLGTGTSNVEKYTLVAMGTPNRIASIKTTLQYGIVGFSGRYEKSQSQTITIGGPIIDFNLSVPQKIISGEEFSFKINFVNNSIKSLSNIRIQLFYPWALIIPVQALNLLMETICGFGGCSILKSPPKLLFAELLLEKLAVFMKWELI